LIVVAVTTAGEAFGVDAEDITRPVDILPIAERNFSRSELFALQRLPVTEQSERFFAYWTLKEAYLKARGVGLAGALDQVRFVLTPGEPISARFAPENAADSTLWSFALLAIGDRHLAAVAIGTGAVRIRWMFGLGSKSPPLCLCFPLRSG
jgi:4'-phosphopantetheinyl transferase